MGLAYDGSAPARKALALSLNISEKAKWPITVLINADTAKAADLSAQVEEMAQQGLADCEIIVSTGREADEILKFIREGSVELMVMGAYGLTVCANGSWAAQHPTSSGKVPFRFC
jgi:nucleotide-binding universal stress UspA family protein